MKATDIANEWLATGRYQEMKDLENEKKAIEKELRSRMRKDVTRDVHKSTGVILKLVPHNIYKIDNIGLNEFLSDYGVLAQTVKFNKKDLTEEVLEKIEQFKNPDTYYAKINVRLPKAEFEFKGVPKIKLIRRWKRVTKTYKALSELYRLSREQMNQCDELILKGKLKFEYGSISRIKNQVSYNTTAIIEEFGERFVIENANPYGDGIVQFINQGYFSPTEVDQYKTLIDTKDKFVMMTVEDEAKMLSAIQNQRSRASIRREKIRKQDIDAI